MEIAEAQQQASVLNADAEAESAEKTFKQHDDVKCDGFQCSYLFHEDASVSSFFFAPVVSDSALFAAFPVQRKFIGEKGANMVACGNIPCNARSIEGLQKPRKFVKIPMRVKVVMMYRSLSSAPDSPPRQAVFPEVVLDTGAAVVNLDGSVVFQLCLSELLYSEDQIGEFVGPGKKFENMHMYYESIKRASIVELVRNLEANGVDSRLVFPRRSDVTKADVGLFGSIDPFAVACFSDFLLPNMRPRHDMLIMVPPFGDDGMPNMNGAFSCCLRSWNGPQQLPILGLAHNVDPSDEEPCSVVDDDFFIVSNAPVASIVSDGVGGRNDAVRLSPAIAYAPGGMLDDPSVRHEDQKGLNTAPDDMSDYEDDDVPMYNRPPQEEPDWDAFHGAVEQFQQKREEEILEKLQGLADKMGLPPFTKNGIYSINLKGCTFSSSATTLTACY